jgi:hypothetical protein
MEAAMRLACVFLLSLLLLSSSFAQSQLAIDKVDRKSLNEAAKEVPYSALLEGTVGNPDLLVRVLVNESGSSEPHSFQATVDETRIDEAGGYRWRAVCYFGEYNGRGVGQYYKVRVVAVDPKNIKDGADTLSASSLQTDTIEFKRVRN